MITIFSCKIFGSSLLTMAQMLSGLKASLVWHLLSFSYLCSFMCGSNGSSHSCLLMHRSLPLERRPFSPPEVPTILEEPDLVMRSLAEQLRQKQAPLKSLFAPFAQHIPSFTVVIPAHEPPLLLLMHVNLSCSSAPSPLLSLST